MGKHGKSNLSHNDKKSIRQAKKDKFKDNLSKFNLNVSNKQNKELPRLKNHKLNLIYDLENKKPTTAREQLITNLNNKLENDEKDVNKNLSYLHLVQKATDSNKISNEYLSNMVLNQQSTFNKTEETFFHNENIKGNKVNQDFSKKAFMKELKQVVEASDVVLEVVDARDPISFRSKELEDLVKSFQDKKKLIIVVNKIDLVPADYADAWRSYLKSEYPCVLFKANTQNQSSNLSNASLYHSSIGKQKHFVENMINSNKAIGGEDLMNILKNYCRVGDSKKSIVVGIVGFPNVGKSSIINSLIRNRAVGVSSTPGYTRSINEVILDKHIKLLDSPGVVYSNDTEKSLLSNVIRPESISNPVEIVAMIINKVQLDELIRVYDLNKEVENNPMFKVLLEGIFKYSGEFERPPVDLNDVEKFLCVLGMKLGKYQRGGTVDANSTAVSVIQDWNSGKIKYLTPIPSQYINNNMAFD